MPVKRCLALSCFDEVKWCNPPSQMLKCGKSCRWSTNILLDVGARFLLTLLFQQHMIKGCERVSSIHRASLTDVNTGNSSFSRDVLKTDERGKDLHICHSFSHKKGGAGCCFASREGAASESSESKFMWDGGDIWDARAQSGLVCQDKECVCDVKKTQLQKSDYSVKDTRTQFIHNPDQATFILKKSKTAKNHDFLIQY